MQSNYQSERSIMMSALKCQLELVTCFFLRHTQEKQDVKKSLSIHTLLQMNTTLITILLLLNLSFLIILTIGYYIVNWTLFTTTIRQIYINRTSGQETTVLSELPQNMPHSHEYVSNPAQPTSVDLGDLPMQSLHHHAAPDLGSDTQSERTVRPKASREAWNMEYEEYFDLFTQPKRYVKLLYILFSCSWRRIQKGRTTKENWK